MEGFLSMFFFGPDIAWSEYSKYALSHGLGSRMESSASINTLHTDYITDYIKVESEILLLAAKVG